MASERPWKAEADTAASLTANIDDAARVLRLGLAVTAIRSAHRLTIAVNDGHNPLDRGLFLWSFVLAVAYLHEAKVMASWAEGIGPRVGNILYRASLDTVAGNLLPGAEDDAERRELIGEVLSATAIVLQFFEPVEIDIVLTNGQTGEKVEGTVQLSAEETVRYRTLKTDEERLAFEAAMVPKYARQLLARASAAATK
jgi:hypothetical protein